MGFYSDVPMEVIQIVRISDANSARPSAGQIYPDGQFQFRSPEELTVAYLTELVKHMMYTLQQKLGSAVVQSIPLQFVLTVPAIWSEPAKLKTLNVCIKAGIKSKSEILLISEPVSIEDHISISLTDREGSSGDLCPSWS
jgi:molecular chaperone DnaK (HSP70)